MSIDLEEVSRKWLKHHHRISDNVEVLPFNTCVGLAVYFYDSETWEDLKLMITVPQVKKLLEGASYRNV